MSVTTPLDQPSPPLRWSEEHRLAALQSLNILDSADDSDFDDITALAAAICGTPIAAVSLVDADRQWFKSEIGLDVRETPRDQSFCAHAIKVPEEVLVVPDATLDARFTDNVLVTAPPGIRFYAGAPLVTRYGVALGSLCVIDRTPRQLDAGQLEGLRALARQVSRLIERRAGGHDPSPDPVEAAHVGLAFALSPTGMLMATVDGLITHSNAAFAAALGYESSALIGTSTRELGSPEEIVADADSTRELLAGVRTSVRRRKSFLTSDGALVPAIVTSYLLPPADAAREYVDEIDWLTEVEVGNEELHGSRSGEACISVDGEGRVIAWSTSADRMFGWNREEIVGHDLNDAAVTAMLGAGDPWTRYLAPGARPGGQDLRARHRDGTEFPVTVTSSAWERGGNQYRSVAVRDVTDQHRSAELAALVQLAATVANDCATLETAATRLLAALASTSRAAAARCWVAESDAGQEVRLAASWGQAHLDPRRTAPVAADAASTHLRTGTLCVDIVSDAGGTVTVRVPIAFDAHVYGWLEFDGDDALAADHEAHAALLDVTAQLGRVGERARTTTVLTARALTDPLTGLPNRRRILELVQTEIDRFPDDRSCAVLFLDLDRFKAINDSLGHAAGDEVLRTVAARLGAVLREGDTLARIGGDEYLVLCTGLQEVLLAESIARRLIDALVEPITTTGTAVYLGVSIGIAELTSSSTAETVLRQADIAMYRAKNGGGAAYATFDDAMDTDTRLALDMRTALHRALRDGEFVLHYQPVVGTDQLPVGLEALVRWQRPGHGLLQPEAFLPAAQDAGLMEGIGAYVLREATRQLTAWRSEHLALSNLYVAVNVAASQLQGDFLSTVRRALDDSGLPPRLLVLEITESAMLTDLASTTWQLGQLRSRAVRIALDDFGTGYSSLAYLGQLPVDIVKIDRSFVAPLGTSPRADALLNIVLQLADALDISVVAEGVETRQQADWLRERQCDALQGHHYGPAVSAAEVPAAVQRLSAGRSSQTARR